MTRERNEPGSDTLPDERELRDDFAALRGHVEASGAVPDFERMLARARAEASDTADPGLVVEQGGRSVPPATVGSSGRPVWAGRAAWASLAAAAAVAAILVVGSGTDSAEAEFERLVSSYTTDAGLGAWSSPTAGLLRTPGIDLGAVPSVGPVLRRGVDPDRGGRDS